MVRSLAGSTRSRSRVALVVFVVPFAFIVITAVKTRAQAARLDFSWPTSWPVWSNIVEVVTARNDMLVTAMKNSFIVTAVAVTDPGRVLSR